LFEELRFTRNALRQAEPEHPLPCDFGFYWSQIQRRLATAEPEPEPSLWETILAWRRYLAPAAGLALLAFLAVGVARFTGPAADPFQHLAEIVNLDERVGSYAFRSQSENMFVVWVYDKAQPAVGEPEFTEEDMFLQ
jgi:hypothetical protein